MILKCIFDFQSIKPFNLTYNFFEQKRKLSWLITRDFRKKVEMSVLANCLKCLREETNIRVEMIVMTNCPTFSTKVKIKITI